MAGQYELKKFLRHVAVPILKQYFEGIKWIPVVKWEELTGASIDPLFDAIRNAPEDTRERINREFRQINDLATEGGVRTLIDEGKHSAHGRLNLAEELKDVVGLENKVFRVFLDHPSRDERRSVFAVAKEYNRADLLPGRSWRKRSGVPEVKHAKSMDDDAAKELEAGRKRLVLQRHMVHDAAA